MATRERRSLPPPKVNTQWFKGALADANMSQNQLAEHLGIHPTQIGRMFRGKRRMQMPEARVFSRVTGVPITDVIANAGVDVEDVDYGKTTVPVEGSVDDSGKVTMKRVKGRQAAPLPWGTAGGLKAVLFQTDNAWDGAIVYFTPLVGFRNESLGKWCVVELESGSHLLRVVRRGYARNRFNLLNLDGEIAEPDVDVRMASPIIWVKMG